MSAQPEIKLNDKYAIITAHGEQLKFGSRLFINGHWVEIAFKDGIISGIPELEIAWHSEVTPSGIFLKAILKNRGATPLVLGAFHMLESTQSPAGTSYDDMVLVDSAGAWFAGVVRITASCPQYMEYWKNYFLADEDINWAVQSHKDLESGAHYSLGGMMTYKRRNDLLPAWLFSFVVPMKRCSAVPIMLVDPASGSIEAIALSNNFAGYALDPGEKIETEEIMIAASHSPHSVIEEWASCCAGRRHVEVWSKRPPVGWLSWFGYRLTQNAADTVRTAELIRNKLDGLDFEYIQLDLGYNKGNLPGEWFEVNERFSEGLPELAEKISAKGFKLGIWACPFILAADSSFAREHPEALLAGHPDDSDRWFWEPHCKLYLLDPTHPEGEKFLRRMVNYFKSAGVSYFKFDFINRLGRVDKNFTLFNRKIVKGIELYRYGLGIIMDMMDKDDYVYWCSNLLHFGLGLGATSMAAGDIGNTGFSQAREIEGRVEGIEYFRQQATTTMSKYYMHNKLLLLNPDALNLAPPADIEECRMRATLLTMSGGQVFLGDRFDLAEENRFDLIRQCAPPYGEAAKPIDLFKNVYPESYPQVWHLHINSHWDDREIVSFMNYGQSKDYTIALPDLNLSVGHTYHAWEFWEKQNLGKIQNSLCINVPERAARMVVLVPVRKHPWVLSTSFHFTQGGVDLISVEWNEELQILSGILQRPMGMQGEIYIIVPERYSCKLEKLAPGVYSLPLTANGSELQWEVSFSVL